MKRLLTFLILTVAAFAQSTTTVTGTVKDLTNSVVTAGQVTFDLKPGLDTTISGAARFSPSTVVCTINGSGLIKALDGVSACVVTQNTSLTPAGTYYKVCLQPNSITPGSCFNWYALSATFDITTAVPTPGTMPAFTFVDLNSNQVITGIKTHTGIPVFSAGISGTAGQTLALPSSADTLVGRATTDTLTYKTFDTAGVGNSFSINGLAATTNTGAGSVVRATAPTVTNISSDKYTSSVGTGTAPLVVASTTPVANLNASPVAYNAGGTQQTNAHVVFGTCTLGTNCAVTFVGSAAFSLVSSYQCTATDGSAANAVLSNITAANAVTFTGTGTDLIRYICVGN